MQGKPPKKNKDFLIPTEPLKYLEKKEKRSKKQQMPRKGVKNKELQQKTRKGRGGF